MNFVKNYYRCLCDMFHTLKIMFFANLYFSFTKFGTLPKNLQLTMSMTKLPAHIHCTPFQKTGFQPPFARKVAPGTNLVSTNTCRGEKSPLLITFCNTSTALAPIS